MKTNILSLSVLVIFLLCSVTTAAKNEMFMKTPSTADEIRSSLNMTNKEFVKVEAVNLRFLKKTFKISDDAIAQKILESIQDDGGKCPCPYLLNKSGHLCGGNSSYSKPGGRSPVCYPKDVVEPTPDET